jgi:N6-L-threonylcarbamoyladenine synthase
MNKQLKILAIESSCDETSAAVCVDGNILSNIIATQQIHEQYGGVVPELASRAHLEAIDAVVQAALNKANVAINELDAVAYTKSPGLLGPLLVGSGFAKSLALTQNIPLIEVHHMQAHVLANLIENNKGEKVQFPFLCLTVSGGHTQIVHCTSPFNMEIIGETIDDAAGEAFDKTAKILGLPYPGGPLIDKYATNGNPLQYQFTEPQIQGLNYSFSGLKTQFLYFVQQQTANNPNFLKDNINDVCASVQHRIITVLLNKFKKAIKQTKVKNICLAGGVSANTYLRKHFFELGVKHQCKVYIPDFEYCTDNAGMIAITAYYKFLQADFADLSSVPNARAGF